LNLVDNKEVGVVYKNIRASSVSKLAFARSLCVFNKTEETTLHMFLNAPRLKNNQDIEHLIANSSLHWENVYDPNVNFGINMQRIRCFFFMCGLFNIAAIEGNHRLDCGLRLQNQYLPPFILPLRRNDKNDEMIIPSSNSWYDYSNCLVYFSAWDPEKDHTFFSENLKNVSSRYQRESLKTIDTKIMDYFKDVCVFAESIRNTHQVTFQEWFIFLRRLHASKKMPVERELHDKFKAFFNELNNKIIWYIFNQDDLTKQLPKEMTKEKFSEVFAPTKKTGWFTHSTMTHIPFCLHYLDGSGHKKQFRTDFLSLSEMNNQIRNGK